MNFNLGRLAQVGLNVADLDRAEAFYRETLGLKHLGRVHDFMTFFDCGGVTLLLSKTKPENVGADGVPIFHAATSGFARASLSRAV